MTEIKKFLSRKFLLAFVSSVFAAVAALCGVAGEVGSICSLIAAFAVPICYVVTEGKIDAAALDMIAQSAKKASEILGSTDEDK